MIWIFMILLPFLCSCQHTLQISSQPPDADVYIFNNVTGRAETLGKTPLLMERDKLGTGELHLRKEGFESTRVYVPTGSVADLRVDVKLHPLDKEWILSLPAELKAHLQNQALYDLLDLQTGIYSWPPEKVQEKFAELGGTYDRLSAFHLLAGSYFLFKNQFEEAFRSFEKALELDPSHENARRMMYVSQLRAVEASRSDRARAFAELEQGAKRVALLTNGAIVGTKSHPDLPEPDGFRIMIPTDPIFRPTESRFKRDGKKILEQVASQLKGLTPEFYVHIGVHTDSDPMAEFNLNMPVLAKKMKKSDTLWELSGKRAVAVMLFLRSLGIQAAEWSVAGYADSQPLSENLALSADPSLNRRIEMEIQLTKSGRPQDFAERELEGLKRSLELFMSAEQPENTVTPSSLRQKAAPQPAPRRVQPAAATQKDAKSAEDALEKMRKRKVLEQRMQRPTSSSNSAASEGGRQGDVPVPRLPKLDLPVGGGSP